MSFLVTGMFAVNPVALALFLIFACLTTYYFGRLTMATEIRWEQKAIQRRAASKAKHLVK